ncbi:hypothetical protein B5X24_HaOG213995 [Helicoverpa armigera]|nr:hypothetical protein B5X24_HaOG213995 [Helicoverpa armigera]
MQRLNRLIQDSDEEVITRRPRWLKERIDLLEYNDDRDFTTQQLLGTLTFYVTNSTQMLIGDICGWSIPTANKIIHRVSATIAALHKEYIHFPTTQQEMRKEQDNFYQIARFPRVIDGWHTKNYHKYLSGAKWEVNKQNYTGTEKVVGENTQVIVEKKHYGLVTCKTACISIIHSHFAFDSKRP